MTTSGRRETRLQVFVEIEMTVSHLYQAFATSFPHQAEVWRELAVEEKQHAAWLVELQMAAQEQVLTLAVAPERHQLAQGMLAELRETLQTAREQGFSAAEAVQLALSLENSLLEKEFYEVAASRVATITPIFEALRTATSRHANRLAALADAQQVPLT